MSTDFHAYLRSRGVPLVEMEPGAVTPLRFSEPSREHQATRSRAGLFDFSFMSCFEIGGAEARPFLRRLQTRNLARLRPGRFLYTLLLREDGTVHIDATLWDLGQGRYWVITGRRSDLAHLEQVARGMDVTIEDRSGRDAVFALQGPASHAILGGLIGGDLSSLRYFGFCPAQLGGEPVLVARAGYSGEAGYEILVDGARAVSVWNHLSEAGRPGEVVECGLECMDSLRVEAGLILFARELVWRLTPQTLGLARLVDAPPARPGFLGATALRRHQASPSGSLKLVGLMPQRGEIPEPDLPPVANAAPEIQPGYALVTSRIDSPVWSQALGLGLVAMEDAWAGSLVTATNGARMRVARLPFYDPAKRLPRVSATPAARPGSR